VFNKAERYTNYPELQLLVIVLKKSIDKYKKENIVLKAMNENMEEK